MHLCRKTDWCLEPSLVEGAIEAKVIELSGRASFRDLGIIYGDLKLQGRIRRETTLLIDHYLLTFIC